MNWRLSFFSVSLFALAGCGKSDIAAVEGTITMDGKPLSGASVVFQPPGGRPSGARTNEEGKYVLNYSGGRKGAIPGLNRVKISTQADPYEDEAGNPVKATPETIPMKYNTRTELEFTVVEGERNVANFDLKSDGPIDKAGGGY